MAGWPVNQWMFAGHSVSGLPRLDSPLRTRSRRATRPPGAVATIAAPRRPSLACSHHAASESLVGRPRTGTAGLEGQTPPAPRGGREPRAGAGLAEQLVYAKVWRIE
jgi:hypothetical protein